MSEEIIRSDFASVKRTIRGLTLYNNCDAVIGAQIATEGEWAEFELQLCDQFLKPGMVCLDVGAHIGTHTTAFAKSVSPGGVVFAYEPQRIPFQMLCANAMLNGLDNIFARRCFVGANSTVHEVPNVNPRNAINHGNFGLHSDVARGLMYTDIQEIRLDDQLFHAVNLIKIDTEGNELNVIRGALGTIEKHAPVIMFEHNNDADTAAAHALLEPLGYLAYWSFTPSQRPDNFYGAKVETTYMDKTIVCVPQGSKMRNGELYRNGDTLDIVMKRMEPK